MVDVQACHDWEPEFVCCEDGRAVWAQLLGVTAVAWVAKAWRSGASTSTSEDALG
jgi:hypothetical protein